MLSSCVLLTVLCAAASSQQARTSAAPPNDKGYWEAPFNHDLAGFEIAPRRFNALHMALIPRGPLRGRVITWDVDGSQPTASWSQRWAILDLSVPGAPGFQNAELALPVNAGDLFCAGLAWTGDGDLLLAGGTERYIGDGLVQHGGFHGGKLAYLWHPEPGAMGNWERLPDLYVDRWYPTVVRLASGRMMVAGGLQDVARPMINDYEVFDLPQDLTPHLRRFRPRYAGPALPASPFLIYPRLHRLQTGEVFQAGMGGASARMDPEAAPGVWIFTNQGTWFARTYVASVTVPAPPGRPDEVLILGGQIPNASLLVTDSVESCRPTAAGSPDWNWTPRPPLLRPRVDANAVVLPDRSVLVIGGRSTEILPPQPEDWVREPELLVEPWAGTERRLLPPMASPRTYHSTALLLPDGRVLSGGGDTATWDYQVYVPPCLTTGHPRPRIDAAPEVLTLGQGATLDYSFPPPPAGTGTEQVGHVTLIAPGAVTHHWDSSQRYVEMEITSVTQDQVTFTAPPDTNHASRGHYMLFLVSRAGVPSVAHWVEVR